MTSSVRLDVWWGQNEIDDFIPESLSSCNPVPVLGEKGAALLDFFGYDVMDPEGKKFGAENAADNDGHSGGFLYCVENQIFEGTELKTDMFVLIFRAHGTD
ncbi:hypothetical protein QJS10_CPA01g00528 [Acorus calamus]|uniref:Uncharacterized protein n=1 Tax=Acorus calamus TaxID=4465 RepID=A0AAV9FWT5_ACOCL|nr:hypothetical protein QJS10_CPA01g00528 [Acorus calamus]